MTKKAASLLLAASLAFSICATPVFATGITPVMGSQNGAAAGTGTDTQVLYNVTKEYTWTLPATIDFGENAGVGNTSTVEAKLEGTDTGVKADKETSGTKWKGTAPKVCVTKNVIGTGETLKIQLKAKDDTAFKVKNESSTELSYEVKTVNAKVDGSTATSYSNQPVAATGTYILALNAGQNTGEVELEFVLTTATSRAEIAGNYTDTVTFTASIATT